MKELTGRLVFIERSQMFFSVIYFSVCASKYSGGSVLYYPDFHVVRNAAAAEKFENEFV